MPFKIIYQIYDSKHTAPVYETSNKTMANIEWNAAIRKGGDIYRLHQVVIPDEMTKPEKYLFLVYKIRGLWKRYYVSRKKEDLIAVLEQEKKLDDWNKRTREFLDSHMKVMDGKTTERYNFFLVVEAWRAAWKKRQAYKGPGCNKQVLQEMLRECRQYEKEIDNYIKNKLNLL